MATLHAGVPMISKEQSDIALLRKDIERIEQRIDQRIDGLEQRIDQRFEVVEQRIDGLEQRIDQRIDGLDKRIDSLEDKVNSIESRIISSLRWSAVFVVSVISAVIAFLTFWPLISQ